MNLLRVISVALVMSSSGMTGAKEMSEALLKRYHDERVMSLIDACMQRGDLHASATLGNGGHVWYLDRYGQIKGLFHYMRLDEMRRILQDEEQEKGLAEGALKRKLSEWKAFKNLDDLKIQGLENPVVEKIAKNRVAFLAAIANIRSADMDPVIKGVTEDTMRVIASSQRALQYKHPLVHRLQRLPVNLYNRLKKKQ